MRRPFVVVASGLPPSVPTGVHQQPVHLFSLAIEQFHAAEHLFEVSLASRAADSVCSELEGVPTSASVGARSSEQTFASEGHILAIYLLSVVRLCYAFA